MARNKVKYHIKSPKRPPGFKSYSASVSTPCLAHSKLLAFLLRASLAYLLLFVGLPISMLYASCPNPAYDKCPSVSNQVGVHYVDPWLLLVDTVVEPGDSSDHIYYWCLKATPPVGHDEEFPIDWQDPPIDWNAGTTCGGYAGVRTPSSLEPGPWRPTTIYVGRNRTPISPMVKKPKHTAAMVMPDDQHEYRTAIFVGLPLKSGASELGDMELTLVSAFSRSENDPKLVNYYLEYESKIAVGESFASFRFDPNAVSHIEELKGTFTPREETRRIEFSSFGPPANLISSITFVDSGGEIIGKVPVSLALPLDE